MSEQNQSEIIIYQTEDGLTRVNVTFSDETVWLSQQQIAELFQKSRTTIVEHIHNILKKGSWKKPQLVGIIDRFKRRGAERSAEPFH